ncbi:CKLF-like MARVEL transmembrane domain-containing protein 4 [Penaeus monodon]|uniref:CKLF-like MARVEL transmembrane domain-containing protein 4 n=1 Tax=Penaeus monodon TaxID=6687 RepID=UPI0018A77ED9|nr:CKLF-like MARVEL transmembrane domain-containing protein 4 [Penaeus monodon]XP_037790946.1 CKLF-like MARVEL transmembrane domain-containing protein 4 [Penaeus monodon]
MEPGMADPGFPTSPTAANTATASMPGLPGIRFDPIYFRSIPGILKCVQMVLNLVGYICVMCSVQSDAYTAGWFSFVSMTGFWVTGILLVLYLMHVLEKFHMVPWLFQELGYCALWTFFYFTASTACASWGGYYPAWAAAAFFGYAAMIAYGVDAFFKFKGWRSGEMAQGERQMRAGGPEMQSPDAY